MFIKSQSMLTEILNKYKIPINEWGTGGSKSIKSLFREIVGGETNLVVKNDMLLREVEALSIVVTYKDLILKESYQRFIDGRIRRRKMIASVAEKLDKNDKDRHLAVIRGIKEELGITLNKSQIIEGKIDSNSRISTSYPGILTNTILYRFNVELLDDQFNIDGYIEVQEDKSTYFIWEKK